MKCPYKYCIPPKRNPECHCNCTEYDVWRKEMDKVNGEKMKEASMTSVLVTNKKILNIKKMKRKRK